MMRLAFLTMAAMAMLVLAAPASAADNDPPTERQIKNRARPEDLQALEAMQKRREYQQQQQIYRELDRPITQPPRLEVPIMQPGGVRR
ncbi:hypothetical protein EET67_02795 [Pseudaminobacter arsenicus]|uniref:ShlB/FhaC/HecB family hemolysin secretion/activation protein n=1 Tax=Borborobacter arsenicus TaxID=1851146 RepID=A0A432VCC8_9HYPH|nr:hypothetical protein [Pseudaminobacter arsenicus]RUM99828.1 hypothetical protein EET67_02795 [Pseudaminobacter arsenicus]